MFDLIFNKDDSLKKLASIWGAPQEMDAKFRFNVILLQLPNKKVTVPDCCHIGASLIIRYVNFIIIIIYLYLFRQALL